LSFLHKSEESREDVFVNEIFGEVEKESVGGIVRRDIFSAELGETLGILSEQFL